VCGREERGEEERRSRVSGRAGDDEWCVLARFSPIHFRFLSLTSSTPAPPPPSAASLNARDHEIRHIQSHNMQAARYTKFGDASVVNVTAIDKPAPKPGHAVVRVVAAALNPVDFKVRLGAAHPSLGGTKT